MNERCNLGDTDLKLTLRHELKITWKRNVVIKSKIKIVVITKVSILEYDTLWYSPFLIDTWKILLIYF